MNKKLMAFIAVICFGALLYLWSGKEKTMQEKADQKMSVNQEHVHGTALPQIEKLSLAVETFSGDTLEPIDLIPGEIKNISGTDYDLRVTEFYTHWNWDKHAINLTYREINPAVKVEILKDEKVLSYGWGFKNMPFFRMKAKTENPADNFAFELVDYSGLTIPSDEQMKGEGK